MTTSHWRKSSHSGGTNSQSSCVELASGLNAVRDSKNPTGPTLRANLVALLGAVKTGQLNR